MIYQGVSLKKGIAFSFVLYVVGMLLACSFVRFDQSLFVFEVAVALAFCISGGIGFLPVLNKVKDLLTVKVALFLCFFFNGFSIFILFCYNKIVFKPFFEEIQFWFVFILSWFISLLFLFFPLFLYKASKL